MRTGCLVILASLGLWTTVTWLAARAEGYSPFDTEPWGHWDTGWYRTIALDGYSFGHCDSVPNRSPTDYCGAAGWFPGYPYLNRVVSHLGIGVDTAGRCVALAAFVVFLAVVWFAFLAARPLSQALPTMALIAVFPGSVYFGAIFPVSMVCASMAGCLALMQRGRWLAAGLCATVAVVAYPSGIGIGLAALVPLCGFASSQHSSSGPTARVKAAAALASPIAAAYVLVLLNYQRAVGRWDAWFRVQEAYGYEATFPWVTVWHQLQLITDSQRVGTPGAQTLLVLVILACAGVVAARGWGELGSGERAVVPVVVALWLLPLTLGGDLSLYRAEALLVPIVVLVARARPAVGWALAALSMPIAYNMARLYFRNVLI